jgi:hypothetical protein
MSKVVKINQSDIENIVNNIVSEEMDFENSIAKEEESNEPKRNISLVKDEQGRYHILDTDTGDIIASK